MGWRRVFWAVRRQLRRALRPEPYAGAVARRRRAWGSKLGSPDAGASRAPVPFFRVLLAHPPNRAGALSSSAEASEDASFTKQNKKNTKAVKRCARRAAAERGRNEGPAAGQPALGTVSAAVLPGQRLHDSQPCHGTAAGVGPGRRGGATTAAVLRSEADHRSRTTTMRTKASPARRC